MIRILAMVLLLAIDCNGGVRFVRQSEGYYYPKPDKPFLLPTKSPAGASSTIRTTSVQPESTAATAEQSGSTIEELTDSPTSTIQSQTSSSAMLSSMSSQQLEQTSGEPSSDDESTSETESSTMTTPQTTTEEDTDNNLTPGASQQSVTSTESMSEVSVTHTSATEEKTQASDISNEGYNSPKPKIPFSLPSASENNPQTPGSSAGDNNRPRPDTPSSSSSTTETEKSQTAGISNSANDHPTSSTSLISQTTNKNQGSDISSEEYDYLPPKISFPLPSATSQSPGISSGADDRQRPNNPFPSTSRSDTDTGEISNTGYNYPKPKIPFPLPL